MRLLTFRRFAERWRGLSCGEISSDSEITRAWRPGVYPETSHDRPPTPAVALQAEAWPADVPLASVVVVCFNYGRFVDEALSSVLAQTAVGHCEILVVDGGSDDPETIAKMRELANDPPPRTRVLLREDGRHLIGDNRNFGIARARGRYMMCLDADDLLDPRYLEIALYLLERRGYDAVSTATLCFGSANGYFDLMESPDLSDMLRANHLTTVAVLRRELWERAGGYHDVGLGGGLRLRGLEALGPYCGSRRPDDQHSCALVPLPRTLGRKPESPRWGGSRYGCAPGGGVGVQRGCRQPRRSGRVCSSTRPGDHGRRGIRKSQDRRASQTADDLDCLAVHCRSEVRNAFSARWQSTLQMSDTGL